MARFEVTIKIEPGKQLGDGMMEWGRCERRGNKWTIRVDKDLSVSQKVGTLMHEFMHLAMDIYGAEVAYEIEEEACQSVDDVAKAMYLWAINRRGR